MAGAGQARQAHHAQQLREAEAGRQAGRQATAAAGGRQRQCTAGRPGAARRTLKAGDPFSEPSEGLIRCLVGRMVRGGEEIVRAQLRQYLRHIGVGLPAASAGRRGENGDRARRGVGRSAPPQFLHRRQRSSGPWRCHGGADALMRPLLPSDEVLCAASLRPGITGRRRRRAGSALGFG